MRKRRYSGECALKQRPRVVITIIVIIIATTAPLTSCLTSEKRLNFSLSFLCFLFGIRQTEECCTKWVNDCEVLRMAVRLELERSSISALQNVWEPPLAQHLCWALGRTSRTASRPRSQGRAETKAHQSWARCALSAQREQPRQAENASRWPWAEL